MAFNIADLILSSCCCLSESFLKYLRFIFLILNLAMLAYPFVALRNNQGGVVVVKEEEVDDSSTRAG